MTSEKFKMVKSKTLIDKQMLRKLNPDIAETIFDAKKNEKWLNVAAALSSPRSNKVSVNLEKIDRESEEGDTILVPGKILGKGEISKKVKVVALSFSEEAERKLKDQKCEIVTIKQEIKSNPKADGFKDANMNELIIDGESAVVGRLASFAAKKLMQGDKISIVNAEKAIVLGNEKDILGRYQVKRARGGAGMKGPFYPKTAERILKRTIRGMIPYKTKRGKALYSNVRCYIGIPPEYEGKKMIKSTGKRTGTTLKTISRRLRGV